MLGKLIKHEFRATRRIMLPLIGGVVLLSVLAGLSIQGLDRIERFGFLGALYSLTLAAFFLALFALCVVALVLMIQRFYRSLLRDEGYIAMTLPVSVDAQIWAKLLVSFIWFAIVAVLSAGAMFLMLSIGTRMNSLSPLISAEEFRQMMQDLRAFVGGGNIALAVVELLVLGFLGVCVVCLRCYASMAIGCSAANHKLAYSFLAYIAIGVVLSIAQSALSIGVLPNLDLAELEAGTEGMASVVRLFHAAMWTGAAVSLVEDALFYGLTRWFLKNRLNLA